MVTLFAPDGTKGTVPIEQMQAAIKAGAKPAITIKSPDGKIGDIPADRLPDAAKAGASVVPIKDQENQHPGFWHAMWGDVSGIPAGVGKMLDAAATGLTNPVAGAVKVAPMAQQISDNMDARVADKRSVAYRTVAPLGDLLGVNTRGMEESANQGDFAGVAGHTAAAVAPVVASEMVAHGAPTALEAASKYGVPIARAAGQTFDALSFDRIGKIWNAWKNLPAEIQARGPQFSDPGAPLPEAPPKELLQARGLATGGAAPTPEPSAALATAGQRPAQAPVPASSPAAEIAAAPEPMSATPNGNTIPRTLSGDSALRQVLTGQDNANLLKIAKSRGINVTRESQLKAGTADNLLINKIVNDFSEDELSEISAQYLENNRFRHVFGQIGPEAWKTMNLQTYFPDMKIPATTLARTAKAVAASATPPAEDLTGILQESLKKAQAIRSASQ